MKRILEKAEKTNFIGSWLISNDHLFENIIDFFENNKSLHSQVQLTME